MEEATMSLRWILPLPIALAVFTAGPAGAQPAFPLEPVEVEVVNLPTSQPVSGSVEVTNLPSVQPVVVLPDGREQVRITGMDDFETPDSVAASIQRVSAFSTPFDAVPSDRKLVLTDLRVRSTTAFNSWHCASLAAALECEGDLVSARRITVCVTPDYSAPSPNPNSAYDYFESVHLTTGVEFPPGYRICLGAGGGRIGSDLDLDFVSIEAFGYLATP